MTLTAFFSRMFADRKRQPAPAPVPPKGMKIAYTPMLSTDSNARLQAFEPLPGVIPAAERGAALAQDATPYDYVNQTLQGGLFFAGYPVLASLSQRPEHRMIVGTLAEEHTRKWIELQATGEADKAGKIKQLEDAMRRLRLREVFKDALEHDGFFGRGQIYIEVKTPSGELASDNPDELGKLLAARPEKIGKGALVAFRNVEPMWTYPQQYQSTNPLGNDYYQPQGWYVMGRKVHASRLLTLVGRPVPDILKPAYNFGGVPLVQLLDPYVNNWLRTRDSVSDLIHSFSTSIIKTNMSAQIFKSADWSHIHERAKAFNDLRDNRGLMMLDMEAEDFLQVNTPLSTLDNLQAQAQEHMASISGIPLVKLLGTQPAGLNASSDGEIRVFYDRVRASQQDNLRPLIERALAIIQLSEFGQIDPEITFDFCPLYEMSEEQQATIRKAEADTDAVYVQAGVLDPAEVRQRLASDETSLYHGLDVDAVPQQDDDDDGQADQDPAPDAP